MLVYRLVERSSLLSLYFPTLYYEDFQMVMVPFLVLESDNNSIGGGRKLFLF